MKTSTGWFLVYGALGNEGMIAPGAPPVPVGILDDTSEEHVLQSWLYNEGWSAADLDTFDSQDNEYGYRSVVTPILDSFEPNAKRSGRYSVTIHVDVDVIRTVHGPWTVKETVSLLEVVATLRKHMKHARELYEIVKRSEAAFRESGDTYVPLLTGSQNCEASS